MTFNEIMKWYYTVNMNYHFYPSRYNHILFHIYPFRKADPFMAFQLKHLQEIDFKQQTLVSFSKFDNVLRSSASFIRVTSH